jgi:hypothetical protein
MNCFNCGRAIALYSEKWDQIDGEPHCGLCREYERKLADKDALINRLAHQLWVLDELYSDHCGDESDYE